MPVVRHTFPKCKSHSIDTGSVDNATVDRSFERVARHQAFNGLDAETHRTIELSSFRFRGSRIGRDGIERFSIEQCERLGGVGRRQAEQQTDGCRKRDRCEALSEGKIPHRHATVELKCKERRASQ